jgi:hypothetical protein
MWPAREPSSDLDGTEAGTMSQSMETGARQLARGQRGARSGERQQSATDPDPHRRNQGGPARAPWPRGTVL